MGRMTNIYEHYNIYIYSLHIVTLYFFHILIILTDVLVSHWLPKVIKLTLASYVEIEMKSYVLFFKPDIQVLKPYIMVTMRRHIQTDQLVRDPPETLGQPTSSALSNRSIPTRGDDLENPREEEDVRSTIWPIVDVPQTRLVGPRPDMLEVVERHLEVLQRDYIRRGESPLNTVIHDNSRKSDDQNRSPEKTWGYGPSRKHHHVVSVFDRLEPQNHPSITK